MPATSPAKSTSRTVPEWDRLAVTELLAHNTIGEADPELTTTIKEHGITDPLYVTTLDGAGVRILDGKARLAAASALDLPDVPVTYRPVIRTDALIANPGNVRPDLELTDEFRTSIRTEGVLVPVLIKRTDNGLEVDDGARRLAAAVAEGLTHVPYAYDERDEASRDLDMITTAEHRAKLPESAVAAALFRASQHGADIKRMAAAAGWTQKKTREAAKTAGAASVQKATSDPAAAYLLSLDELADLAELEKADPEAAASIAERMQADPRQMWRYEIKRALMTVEYQRSAEKHRAELEEAGARIRPFGEIAERAEPVSRLIDIATADKHATCQGDVWALQDGADRYERYCANARFYGHRLPNSEAPKPSTAQRRKVIEGNKDWDAAEEVRRAWLAEVCGRASHTKAQNEQFTRATAHALLSASDVIVSKLAGAKTRQLLAELLGVSEGASYARLAERADSAAKRNPAHAFAVVAAAHELYLPRSTWRTDNGHDRHPARAAAAWWLTHLKAMGYELSPIEAATAAGETYDPDADNPDAEPLS